MEENKYIFDLEEIMKDENQEKQNIRKKKHKTGRAVAWLVLVAILLILHFALHWPLWLIIIPIAVWFIHSLLITLLLSIGNRASSGPAPVQENKNPYSAKNKDLFQ